MTILRSIIESTDLTHSACWQARKRYWQEILSFNMARKLGQLLEVEASIWEKILSGAYPPGSRIATFDSLCRKLPASRHTVARAVSRLCREGFLEANPGKGTYVSQRPPHLYRYALLSREGHPPTSFVDSLEIRAGNPLLLPYEFKSHPKQCQMACGDSHVTIM